MRILHVINSLQPAGAERHLANLFGPLESLGAENHLVTFLPGNGFEDAVRRHVRRARLGVGKWNLQEVVRMAHDVDVVHTQLMFSDVLGRTAAAIAGRPSVTTIQTSVWSPEQRTAMYRSRGRVWYHAVRAADAATARLAAHHFAVSTRAMRSHVDGLGLPETRIEVITNSVDLHEFDPAAGPTRDTCRRELGLRPDEFAVVALARLVPLKALDDVVRAVGLASKERAVHLVIAGDGPERARLEALIAETRSPTRLLGHRRATAVLKAADLFVLPSRWEGMPLSLIEAMAMGVPALCSDLAESRETAGDAAVYVSVGDAHGYAREIVALAADGERRALLGRLGMERARTFSSERVARRYVASIERVLGLARDRRRRFAPSFGRR